MSFKKIFFAIVVLSITSVVSTHAGTIRISLAPDTANSSRPAMGNFLHFHSIIKNIGDKSVEGLVAWISLIEIDPGHEQPVDLEDWSAHKAITVARMKPGDTLKTVWPIRLIQHGRYRVAICAADRNHPAIYTSPPLEFHVAKKPVIQSNRIFPVAFGLPLLLIGLIFYRKRQNRRARI